MNKNVLIGSIVAVVILVLVSFTSVVGYNSVESNVKASPLFNMRISRAIDEESKDITCSYVGKGNTLPFPKRDDKAIMFQKVVDRISKMDDKTHERFIAYIINHAQKDKRLIGVKPDRIREALYMLRDSDKPKQIYNVYPENSTFGYEPFCIIKSIILIIIGFIFWRAPPLHTNPLLHCTSSTCNIICRPITLRKLP